MGYIYDLSFVKYTFVPTARERVERRVTLNAALGIEPEYGSPAELRELEEFAADHDARAKAFADADAFAKFQAMQREEPGAREAWLAMPAYARVRARQLWSEAAASRTREAPAVNEPWDPEGVH